MIVFKTGVCKLRITFTKICLAASVKVPKFSVLEDRSVNGSPSIGITFPDGYSDTLILTPFPGDNVDAYNRDESTCLFHGYLANEPEACSAMTGCLGSEDVEFTILSEHAPGTPMFIWRKNGQVELVENAIEV